MERKYIESKIFEEFQTIDRTLTEDNFGLILLSKKLILDKTFTGKQHGELIHLTNRYDVLYIREKWLSNEQIVDFYRWMGKGERISDSDGRTIITPIRDVWVTLFDSFEKTLVGLKLLTHYL